MADDEPAPDDTGADDTPDETPADSTSDSGSGKDDKPGDNAEGDTALTSDDEPEGAPETYADFTVPEDMDVDQQLLEAATPKFKELNLSQEQAQSLVDTYAGALQAQAKAQNDSYAQTLKDWQTEAKADAEIGGDSYDENVAVAKKGIEKFGTPALKKVLNETGLGDHPEFIRAFFRAGQLVSEDDPGGGETPTKGDKSQAEILYPDLAKSG